MNEKITITKAVLVGLFDYAPFPNPDDPGPYGPIGPIIRGDPNPQPDIWRLGPVPDPWRSGPQPDPWRSFNPDPTTWRIAMVARTFIDRLVNQYQLAEILGSKEQTQRAIGQIRSSISDVLDDWCGTPPHKWPWPWPWPPRFEFRPIDQIAAGAQFQKAASLNNPLQAEFSAAADRLFETGLKRMEGHST